MEKNHQTLRVSDSVTQEILEKAQLEAPYASAAKIPFRRLSDNAETSKMRVYSVIDGLSKFKTEEEVISNALRNSRKGECRNVDSSNLAIEELSEIISPELKAIKTKGTSSRIDGVIFDSDINFNEKETESAFFAMCVANVKSECRRISSVHSKTIDKIKNYLSLGAAFIFFVRLDDVVSCAYIITPDEYNEFLDKTKSFKNGNLEFRPAPFTDRKRNKGSLSEALHKYKIYDKDTNKFRALVKKRIIEFEKIAKKSSMYFLLNDKSMLSRSHRKEQVYMESLKSILPDLEIVERTTQGDFRYKIDTNDFTICEVKKSQKVPKSLNSYSSFIRRYAQFIHNYNEIDVYIFAIATIEDRRKNNLSEELDQQIFNVNNYRTFIFLGTRKNKKPTINFDNLKKERLWFRFNKSDKVFDCKCFSGDYLILTIEEKSDMNELKIQAEKFLKKCHNQEFVDESYIKAFDPLTEQELFRIQRKKSRHNKKLKTKTEESTDFEDNSSDSDLEKEIEFDDKDYKILNSYC